jgi:hypothetical protein
MITQFIIPAAAAAAYFGLFRHSVALPLYRRSPTIGNFSTASNTKAALRSWL